MCVCVCVGVCVCVYVCVGEEEWVMALLINVWLLLFSQHVTGDEFVCVCMLARVFMRVRSAV